MKSSYIFYQQARLDAGNNDVQSFARRQEYESKFTIYQIIFPKKLFALKILDQIRIHNDWAYVIFNVVFSFSDGYLRNIITMFAPK